MTKEQIDNINKQLETIAEIQLQNAELELKLKKEKEELVKINNPKSYSYFKKYCELHGLQEGSIKAKEYLKKFSKNNKDFFN